MGVTIQDGRAEDGEQRGAHIYLASGEMWQQYSLGAVTLLRYASTAIDDLRRFCNRHLEERLFRGSILPVPENRDKFVVRAPQRLGYVILNCTLWSLQGSVVAAAFEGFRSAYHGMGGSC